MSLRDAMLQAGLIDKKKKSRAERGLKKQRKQNQGNRQRQSEIRAEEEVARAAAREAAAEARAEARAARAARELEHARRLQAIHLLRAHQIDAPRGPVRFWHRDLEGRLLLRKHLPWSLARSLREGRSAICALQLPGDVDYVIVPARIAERIQQPELIIFWNQEGCPDEPDLQLIADHIEEERR